jgi:hypothetical protein
MYNIIGNDEEDEPSRLTHTTPIPVTSLPHSSSTSVRPPLLPLPPGQSRAITYHYYTNY